MASQAPNDLPPLYADLQPIQRPVHGDKMFKRIDGIRTLGRTHAVPVTVDEFVLVQRHFPIIFSSGEAPVPLALMGLNEGVNTFFDAEGQPRNPDETFYIPAYVRRYPFMLSRLQQDSDQLSLCVDPTAGAIVDTGGDTQLFDGEQPSAATNEILAFCEQFEQAGQRTTAFMRELQDLKLLMEGEVAIQPDGAQQPFIYRGFQMVDEEKFRELSGDKLRKLNQSGGLGVIMSHLFSLSLVRDIFGRQVAQGTGPAGAGAAAPATAEA
ncbi:SapC family protein [Sphingomonas sp. ASV193]|uniref:SapC family protein n=1 Tax=Sphingomonas sp. ASV193 TaxID=3144405 RepID=UPI0032E8D415